MTKKTICIDFDGVIHAYSKGFHDGTIYDPPSEGAYEALMELDQSYKIVVLTARARTKELEQGVWSWLLTYDLTQFIEGVTNVKPAAAAYIDDRAVRYAGEWNETIRDLEWLLRDMG